MLILRVIVMNVHKTCTEGGYEMFGLFKKKQWLPEGFALCSADAPGARAIVRAEIYGKTQVKLAAKSASPSDFPSDNEVAYSYGPGGAELCGDSVGISFTTIDEAERRAADDAFYDDKWPDREKRLPRLRVVESELLYVTVPDGVRARHFGSDD